MRRETKEAVSSIYARVLKWQTSATAARNKAAKEQHRLMMSGKVKAYTDVLSLLKNKYRV